MYVIATAGHVDHGKSTLLHQLTGMQPDRWAEERRRGLTIDLGFVWTELPSGACLAVVDVPGHERFVPNMLAGVGPVPAVLFVVAADEGWMPQSAEHLAALDALGVEHGLLAVTRCDLADPEPARAEALQRIAETSLGTVPSVAVSGRTGDGLEALVRELDALTVRLPDPEVAGDVRLWVDRSFTVRGAGTVVTGTLRAGSLRTGEELLLSSERVRVRGLQALGADRDQVTAVARVAVNLRGVEQDAVARGDTLLTPDAWWDTDAIDVRLQGAEMKPTAALLLHVGSASVPVRVRPLDVGVARLSLARKLPLRVGDRGLLRDPSRAGPMAGVEVLSVRPPVLRRRGAARARARELAAADGHAAALAEVHVRARGLVPAPELHAMGLPPVGREVGGWCVDETHWAALVRRAPEEVARWRERHRLAPAMPVDALGRRLDLPPAALAEVVRAAGLACAGGQVGWPDEGGPVLPAEVEAGVRAVEADLRSEPFAAPAAHRLAELGLGHRELAAAVRSGRLLSIADGVVLLPDAPEQAGRLLGELPQPFSVSQAKQALRTTRRTAVPLLELLASRGRSVRLADGTHRLR